MNQTRRLRGARRRSLKASGWGRFGGRAGLEQFTELRWITVQHGSRRYPI